jgi:hypothetical protein
VIATVLLALALGVGAALSGSRPLVRSPRGTAHLGRLASHRTADEPWPLALQAPYPYRWIAGACEPAMVPPARVANPRKHDLSARELSAAPLAA